MMKNLTKALLNTALGISILLFLLVSPLLANSSAETMPTITISPFLREVKFSDSDATKDIPISITNNSSTAISFSLSVIDFGSLDESGGIVFAGSKSSSIISKYGLATWLQLSTDKLAIDAGQKTEITATIINDSSLKPGGHYAAVVASVDNSDPKLIDQITIDQKLSSLILATKVGGEKYDLKLEKIVTGSSKLRLPKTIELLFSNPGNVHVVPRGTVKIISPSGKVISQGAINEASSFVLPETSRQISVEMHDVSPASFWPALYHVQVDYRYDGIEQFAQKNQLLNYVNIPGLLFITMLGVAITFLVWKHKRKLINYIRRNKSALHKHYKLKKTAKKQHGEKS